MGRGHRALVVAATVVGCGRIAFDPLGGAAVDASIDADPADDPSLIAWYPLDDDVIVTGAKDRSGNGHDAKCGTTTGCPAPAQGRPTGRSAPFDGSDDCLLVPYDSLFDFGGGFTIALWVRPDRTPILPGESCFGRGFGSGTTNSYGIDILDLPASVPEFTSMPEHHLTGAMPIPIGSWSHLAITWDGSTKRLYVGGVLDAQGTTTSIAYAPGSGLLIGCDLDNGSPVKFLFGAIDDVRIYDRALGNLQLADLAR